MNTIVITGRLGRDPEISATKGGNTVCRLSVCDDRGKDTKPIWWRVSVFGKQAEACAAYLAKGRMVCVSGTASIGEYTGKDGQVKTSMDVMSDRVNFINSASDTGSKPEVEDKPATKAEAWPEMSSDDIPF